MRSAELRDKDEAARRKAIPVYSGFVVYFPDAILAVAELSHKATDQHHPGQPMHWERGKSADHTDCMLRHMIDDARGEALDRDGVLHKTKVAWRAMADLQIALEKPEQDGLDAACGRLVDENSKSQKSTEPNSGEWRARSKEETQRYLDQLNTGWSVL